MKGTWKQLLDNHQFRWLFAGNTSLFFGFFATMLLRALLVWDMTHDEMALAYINLATAICMLAVSLLSGVIIDRCERRRIILISQTVVLVAESSIAVLLWLDSLTYEILLLSAVASSLAFPFIMPARTAMMVDTVGKRPLIKATALLSAGMNIARTLSPAFIGFLADWRGFVSCYIFLVGLHAISIVCTIFLDRHQPKTLPNADFFDEFLEGYRYLFRHTSLSMAIIFSVPPMLVVVSLQSLMVVFVDDIWNTSGSGLGIMMAAMGVGGIIGSLLMTWIPDRKIVTPMISGTLCMAGFLIFFAHSSNFWLATIMLLGVSSCSVISQTLTQSAVQLMSDDFIRGRVTTITLMTFSLSPIGTLPLAYIIKHFGAQWALTMAAILLSLVVLLIGKSSPAFRRIDDLSSMATEVQTIPEMYK